MSNETNSVNPLVVQNSGRWLGNDGQWSTFYVHAGTPPQHFDVLPSLKSRTIYILLNADCDNMPVSNCSASRGAEVISSTSSISFDTSYGFQYNASSTWENISMYDVKSDTDYELEENSLYGYDRAGISFVGNASDNLTLGRQAVGVYSTPNERGLSQLWLGRLGLSNLDIEINNIDRPISFIHALKQNGHIPSQSLGYQAGAAYRYNKTAGSLVLGGYDKSRRTNDSLTISSAANLTVGVQSITAILRGGSVTVLNPGVLAVLDTEVSELWLPHNVCDQLASVLNLTYHDDTGRYTLTDAAHNALQSLDGSLEFRLGADIHVDPAIIVEIPYKAFDLQASWPIFNTSTRYFPLRKTANKSQYALGRVFLQETYLVVDWERDEFQLSEAVFSDPMPEPEIITILPYNNQTIVEGGGSSESDPSSKTIVGIVIGVLILFAVVAICWWLWRHKHKQKPQEKDRQDTFRNLHGLGKQGPAELPVHGRVEIEDVHHHRLEMYAPPKPHELGQFNGDNVRFEVWVPPVVYEIGDTSRIDEDLHRRGPYAVHKIQSQ